MFQEIQSKINDRKINFEKLFWYICRELIQVHPKVDYLQIVENLYELTDKGDFLYEEDTNII